MSTTKTKIKGYNLSSIQLQLIFQEWSDKATRDFGTLLFKKELSTWLSKDSDIEDRATYAKFAYESLEIQRLNGMI